MKKILDIKKLLSSGKTISVLTFMLIIGVMLVLFSDSESIDTTEEFDKHNESAEITALHTSNDPNANLESKLKNILSTVKGVGEVNVLINYKTTSEKVVLKENQGSQNEKTVMVGQRETSSPYVTKEESAEIEGIIIVAEGGDKIDVGIAIADAVSALLNLPVHKIKVLKMEG